MAVCSVPTCPSRTLALFDYPKIYRSELTADVSDYREAVINCVRSGYTVLDKPEKVDFYVLPEDEFDRKERDYATTVARSHGIEYLAVKDRGSDRNWVVVCVKKQAEAPKGMVFQQTISVKRNVVMENDGVRVYADGCEEHFV